MIILLLAYCVRYLLYKKLSVSLVFKCQPLKYLKGECVLLHTGSARHVALQVQTDRVQRARGRWSNVKPYDAHAIAMGYTLQGFNFFHQTLHTPHLDAVITSTLTVVSLVCVGTGCCSLISVRRKSKN